MQLGNLRKMLKSELRPPVAVESFTKLILTFSRIVGIAEDIVTPYVWSRYDFLVLPASFPYGGEFSFLISSFVARSDLPDLFRPGMENSNVRNCSFLFSRHLY